MGEGSLCFLLSLLDFRCSVCLTLASFLLTVRMVAATGVFIDLDMSQEVARPRGPRQMRGMLIIWLFPSFLVLMTGLVTSAVSGDLFVLRLHVHTKYPLRAFREHIAIRSMVGIVFGVGLIAFALMRDATAPWMYIIGVGFILFGTSAISKESRVLSVLVLLTALLVARTGEAQTRFERDGPVEPVRLTEACEVTSIVDGDTIDCGAFGRIRLIGMDTPEADQAPFGQMATQTLASLIPVGSEVLIEPDVEATDQYGRILGYIWSGAVMVNWAMVRAGYAVVLTYPPNVQYVDWFESAQITARSEFAGLWEIDGFACEPRAHRRRQC